MNISQPLSNTTLEAPGQHHCAALYCHMPAELVRIRCGEALTSTLSLSIFSSLMPELPVKFRTYEDCKGRNDLHTTWLVSDERNGTSTRYSGNHLDGIAHRIWEALLEKRAPVTTSPKLSLWCSIGITDVSVTCLS
jgi:hypothetical protein